MLTTHRLSIWLLSLMFISSYVNRAVGQVKIGLSVGATDSRILTNIDNREFTEINSDLGYYFGAILRKELSPVFDVGITPALLQKNFSISRTDSFQGMYEKATNNYLQVPMTIGINYGSKVGFSIEIGGYGAYLISARRKGAIADIYSSSNNGKDEESLKLTDYDQKYAFNRKQDNRFEWGMALGAGINYPIKRSCHIFLRGDYYYAFTKRQKEVYINQIPTYNRTVAISIGTYYNLN